MAIVVSVIGVLAAVIGLMGLVQPRRIADIVEYWHGPTRFWLAIGVRLVMGTVMLIAAPECRLPVVVRVIGIIAIVAAVILLFIGQKRLDAFIAWWLARPPNVIRISAVFAMAFGVLIIWSGARMG